MFKLLKQEFLFIPLMFLLMECLRWMLFQYYPETALFDKGSELETFVFCVWQFVWISSASLILLRVVLPPIYFEFKEFYNTLTSRTKNERHTAAIIFYIAFLFGMICLVSGKAATTNETFIRKKLVDTLTSQLHVREATGRNDGFEVEKYLSFVGRFKGDAWCAAFASWNLHAVGITAPPNPKSGWSPNFSTPQYTIWSHELLKQRKEKPIKPGDCFTLFYSSLKRVGHVGFIVEEKDNYFITIEGNTGLTGSREGSGVHKYKRPKSKVYRVTNYITPFITHYEKAYNTHSRIGNDQRLPQKPNYVYRKDTGDYQYISYRKGFDLLHRQPLPVDRGQFGNQVNAKVYCSSGRAGNHLSKSESQPLSGHPVRSPDIKVQLPGSGTLVENQKQANQNTFNYKLQKAGYTIYRKNQADTLFAIMGKGAVLDWRY